ncbi:pyridoxal-phosphate dependent enzyme, partial [Candidatus Dojkabacteria bacterium]|nr:pyridoxal-phosphate dependent enzyme [Candidatus Dojkabacteria bacterium]
YQLSHHYNNGVKSFVISSSGNAAVSAAAYAALVDIELDIFVAEKVNPVKLQLIEKHTNNNIRVRQSKKPKSDAIKFASENNAFNLRGSLDHNAVIGFKTIAYELAEQAPDTDAIFIPCSSGTSSVGIAEGFHESDMNVRINVCQTTKIHPIAKEYDSDYQMSVSSMADAISDRVAHRKQQVTELIESTGGFGWVISDDELLKARKLLPLVDFEISNNSLLSLAGLIKSLEAGNSYNAPTLLISGK